METLIVMLLQLFAVAGLLKWVMPRVSSNRVCLASNDGGSILLGALSIVGFQMLFNFAYCFVIAVISVVFVSGTTLGLLFAGTVDSALSALDIVAFIVLIAAGVVTAFFTYMGAIRATGRLFPNVLRVTASWSETFAPAVMIMISNLVIGTMVSVIFNAV